MNDDENKTQIIVRNNTDTNCSVFLCFCSFWPTSLGIFIIETPVEINLNTKKEDDIL